MATIYSRKTKTGKTRWSVLIRWSGLPTEHKTFPNKIQATRWAKKRETELSEGRNLLRRESERHTLANLVDLYLDEIAPHARHRKNQEKQAAHLAWWRDHLGDYRLCDLTAPVIAQAKRRLLNGGGLSGGKLSGATVNRYLAALSRILTVAVRELGWLESSPMPKVERLPESPGRVRFLSADERDALLDAADNDHNPLIYPAIAVALSTGGRRSEVLGLRWTDVDLSPGEERVVFRDTKNGETRSVALTGIGLQEVLGLRRHKLLRARFLFPSRDHSKPTELREAFIRVCAAAGLEDFVFHDLRHTFASYLAMSGATLAEIADAMGHKTLAMVKRYAHLSPHHTRSVVDRMHQQFLAG